ncbi:FixH family protein [Persicobacter psychrovividus]|uniref:Nitrogen fixation protein FixH n=1 Tax=Persicobacter psychrovividus TaxID=387638 RepID=A0ABN6LB12_9BACT|nr:hypothetical protein PEPS_26000 [Persicobacter psychrovividus]
MNWGKGIILVTGAFMVFIISLVVMMCRTDQFLVAEDYYKQELAYQDQIDRIKNVQGLDGVVTVELSSDRKTAFVALPSEMIGKIKEGQIHWFRPDNARLDVAQPIEDNEIGRWVCDLSQMKKGRWRVRTTWTDGQKEYFDEKVITL